ncbi:MAG: hypothetical protein ACYCT0_02810 [Sulfobacillus sp.]
MAGEMEQVPVTDIEILIRRIPTVLRCHVTVNDWGGVEEIHVLSTVARTPKQIVRDIESALLAQWNLRVDHKRISVAQILEDQPTYPLGRITVAEFHMDWDTVQQQGHASVVLQPSNDISTSYRGEWHGRYVPSQYHQVMAWAAVEAINQIPEFGDRFVLSELRSFPLGGRSVVAVALSYLNPRRREDILVGAVQEKGDGQGAAIRAVLDAVNRRLGRIRRAKTQAAESLDANEEEMADGGS